MSNVLNDEKKQQIIALGKLGWSLRRIQTAIGIRRETVSSYLKEAGIAVRPPGGCRRRRIEFCSLVGREFLNQRRQETLNLSIGIAKRLNSLDGVADCRAIPAVVERADPSGAPPYDSMCQVHGNLPMERCRDLAFQKCWRRLPTAGSSSSPAGG